RQRPHRRDILRVLRIVGDAPQRAAPAQERDQNLQDPENDVHGISEMFPEMNRDEDYRDGSGTEYTAWITPPLAPGAPAAPQVARASRPSRTPLPRARLPDP